MLKTENYKWVLFKPVQLSDEPVRDSREIRALTNIPWYLSEYDMFSPYPRRSGVIGSDGNISYRSRTSGGYDVVATQTQLPSKDDLGPNDLVRVERWDQATGEVFYHGSKPPTSEFWLHQKLYETFSDVGWVIHAHPPILELFSPKSQRMWRELGIVATKQFAPDGALEVPDSVIEVVDDDPKGRYVILTGHGTEWDNDHIGVVVMDDDPDRIKRRIEQIHNRLRTA